MKGHIERRPTKSGGISWRLTVSTGITDGSGKYVRVRETYSGTRAQAEKRLRDIISQVETGEYVSPKRAGTVGEVLDAWLESMRVKSEISGKPRRRTVETYLLISDRYVKPLIGDEPLKALTPSRIEKFHQQLTDRKKSDGQRLSTVTMGHAHRVVSMALRHAVRVGKITSNPAETVGAPPQRRRQVETIDPERAGRVFEELERTTPVCAAAAMLALATGARRSEICGLNWSDLDLDGRTISITKAYIDSRSGPELVETKTAKSRRRASVPESALKMLSEWREIAQRETELFEVHLTGGTPLFCTADGVRLQPQSLSRAWRRACKRVGVSIKFHALRHTFATTALEAGVPLPFVSNQLGHASITITADTYGHVAESFGRHAADAVGERFSDAFYPDSAPDLSLRSPTADRTFSNKSPS